MADKQLDETQWTQLYRCTCGRDIDLGVAPNECPECKRPITTAAQTDVSMTMTLGNVTTPDVAATEADHPDELIGVQLGHFKILSKLGSGGMGQVFRALDTSLQRYVAVKVLRNHSKGQADSQANEHLLQEAIAQARVNHPNVVTIYYVGRHQGNAFLAMELASDETLGARLKEGPLDYDQISKIAIQVADALEDSHAMGIVHGDIKPNNILLSNSGRAKLSDFGMSRLIGQEKETGSVGGTPNYLAPELLVGGTPTIQSDIYALGVTLFEMTFGRLPVQMSGTSVDAWRESHEQSTINFPTPLPDHLPAKWLKVLARMLHKDPSWRYADYKQLQNDLVNIRPMSSAPARAFPRAIAWLFDFNLLLMFTLPLMAIFSALLESMDFPLAFQKAAVVVVAAVPVVLYFILLLCWSQSIGRHLMSIKVVNQYGLPPSRTGMALREMFRLGPLLTTMVIVSLLSQPANVNFVVQLLLFLMICISSVTAMFNRRRKTILDMVCRTQVILDSRTG